MPTAPTTRCTGMSEADFETVRWWLFPVQRDMQWTLAVVDPTLATITHFNPTGGGWPPWGHHGLGYHASAVAVTDAELLELGSWYTRMQTVAAPARAMASATGASHLPPPPAQPAWTVHRLADGLPQPFQAHDSGSYVAGFIECIMDGRAWDFQDGDGAALRARANAMEADASETAAATGTVPAQDALAAPVATSSATSSSALAPARPRAAAAPSAPRAAAPAAPHAAAPAALPSPAPAAAPAAWQYDQTQSWFVVPLVHATRRRELNLPETAQTATLRAFMAARHMPMTLDALMDRLAASLAARHIPLTPQGLGIDPNGYIKSAQQDALLAPLFDGVPAADPILALGEAIVLHYVAGTAAMSARRRA